MTPGVTVGETLVDRWGRRHNYLRISLTENCNLNCIYCRKPDRIRPDPPWQTAELLRLIRVAADMGITRIRLTGGEPLLATGLIPLIEGIKRIPEIRDLAMTTNGILLAQKASELRKAGLDRINISLDTLDATRYREVTQGGIMEWVMDGLQEAIRNEFPVKLNVVLMKGINENDIPTFLQLARETPLEVRFIEYMPVGKPWREVRRFFLASGTVLEIASRLGYCLNPLTPDWQPAIRFAIAGGRGSVGLISAISAAFCVRCNRLRLTADGYLRPCLFWADQIPVRPFLEDTRRMRDLFAMAMVRKRKKRPVLRSWHGGAETEMARIGG